ncbi:suppressor of IKBKE 1 isoform X2 [Gopherus flavomarginatus]|uniref:suppressor of IKBKE 1 isoform X2 n=1 Tax=Gopherus flavomarginatus TaxID=286002 RepID=UPI0021CB9A26|nr:suppressor of IKBKE 1 isoform X2 [Gopherus flavomarginatus]
MRGPPGPGGGAEAAAEEEGMFPTWEAGAYYCCLFSVLTMTCTIEKILTDAKTLLERLKDHDNAAESLIDQSTVLHKRVAAMKEIGTSLSEKVSIGDTILLCKRVIQMYVILGKSVPLFCKYQEDAADLKDISKYKPHILLSQENTQIRDLQQENRELWISLEEHQDALELIMSKYRKQMLHLIMGRKDVDAEPVLKVHEAHSLEIESHVDRICEMGEAMRKAVQVDDDQFCKIQEKLAQLEPKCRFCSLKIKSCGSCYPSAKKLSR